MRNHLVAFVICLILAVIFTLPASISPSSGLLGYPGDNYQHAWFLWHFAHAIAKGQNPFYTDLIFYPSHVDLLWSTMDPLAGILALPLSLTVGPVIAYNLSLILQLALTAFVARLLCLRICGNEAAALIGGIAFGFSAFMLAHALGHLSLVTAFPLPLYVLALDKLLREERPSWKDGVITGLALLLTAFAHFNYTVFCLMFTAVALVTEFVSEGVRFVQRVWMPSCLAAATFLAGLTPLLIVLLGNPTNVPDPRPLDHMEQYSADALGFLVPSWNHVLFGSFARTLDPRIFTGGFEGTVYVGPIVLLLACVGFWKGRKTQPRWAIRAMFAAALFYVLSWGPKARFLGKSLDVPAPAAVLYHFRFARFVSAPARFHVLTMLCLSILGSMGLAFLLNELQGKWQRACLVAAVSVMLIVESLTVPFPSSSPVDPAWPPAASGMGQRCTLPASIQSGTVLTFPLVDRPYSIKGMWMQVLDHGRYALVDGYVSYAPERIWKEWYAVPILRSLMSLQGKLSTPIDPPSDKQAAPSVARQFNLSAVVVFDSPQHDAGVGYVEAVFGRNGQRAGSCTVFEIQPNQSAAERKAEFAR
jgi:hypothetical protein